MTPGSLLLDAAIGFAGGSVIGLVVDTPDISIKDVMSYGVGGAVIMVVWLFLQHLKAKATEDAAERKQAADLIATERSTAALERQHAMDRVNEITSTFSKTVLDIVARK